ncbi:MAG: protein kinase domain-containing protein [bacterium JZ-2024 1]
MGRYEVRDVLGSGRFGDVYLAHDPLLNLEVALKRSRAPAEMYRDALSEARMIARLSHPNIVRFFTAEIVDDFVVLVMEYVEGMTLRQWMNRRGVLSEQEAMALMTPVLEGLAYAHESGVIHRDIKPENILLAQDARVVKLADFGLAAFNRLDPAMSVAGTPNYMAPEAWDGIFETASDVYSCAIILYEMTTGVNPIFGKTLNEVRENCLKAVRFGALGKRLSKRFQEAVETALSPDARQRPQDARALVNLLTTQAPHRIPVPRVTAFDWNATTSPEETLRVLSEYQRAFVQDDAARIAVLGGPGTGKTFALAAKAIYLIHDKGVPPECVVMTTFTTKACKDIAFRLERVLGARAKAMALYHFHHLCWKVLRADADRLALFHGARGDPEETPSGQVPLEIILPDRLPSITARLARSIQAKRSGNYLYERVARLRLAMGTRESLATITPEDLQSELKAFWEGWEKNINGSGLLSYDDVLYYTYQLLKWNPDIASEYRQQFRHIFVDEYQDFSAIQAEILCLLVGNETQWVVAGDPDQSIYKWRGASPEFLQQFVRDTTRTRVYHLNIAFRLPRKMAKIAQNLMRSSDLVLPGPSVEDGVVEVVAADKPHDIGNYVARQIQRLKAEGFAYSDIAVLYRFAFRSRFIEDALQAAHIPYSLMFTKSFYRRPEIDQMIRILQWAVRPDDPHLRELVLKEFDRLGWCRAYPSRFSTRSTRGCPPRGVLEVLGPSESGETEFSRHPQEVSTAGSSSFVDLMEQVRNAEWRDRPSRILQFFAEHLQVIDETRFSFVRESIQELIQIAGDYEEKAKEDASTTGFLEQLEFLKQSDLLGGEDAVNLATVHSAKGLEFRAVFVVGLVEGEFPVDTVKPEELAEERRLFLVGVTRARERLYLCYPRKDESGRGTEPSRFIREAIAP